jgi:hypothetical protein
VLTPAHDLECKRKRRGNCEQVCSKCLDFYNLLQQLNQYTVKVKTLSPTSYTGKGLSLPALYSRYFQRPFLTITVNIVHKTSSCTTNTHFQVCVQPPDRSHTLFFLFAPKSFVAPSSKPSMIACCKVRFLLPARFLFCLIHTKEQVILQGMQTSINVSTRFGCLPYPKAKQHTSVQLRGEKLKK